MSYQQYAELILDTARQSIKHGLQQHHALKPDHANIPEPLLAKGASFVTLQLDGQLRGCIGSLEAYRPLIDDIAENAYAAAFRDPRFAPLSQQELSQLDIHASVLTPATEMQFSDEADLINQIRPDIDGLIIEDNGRRGTFLPSVWESLPKTEDFLAHLKMKAGLPADYWSDSLKVSRYTTESIA